MVLLNGDNLEYKEFINKCKKSKDIQMWVQLTNSDGAYFSIPKREFLKTIKRSSSFLDGYDPIIATVQGNLVKIG